MKLFAFTLGAALISGGSLLSIEPTLELAQAGSALALGAVTTGPGSAKNHVAKPAARLRSIEIQL
jgi:hypothetical protein